MRLSHCPFGTSNSASSSHLIPILAQWITYFEHFREERVMQQIQHPPVQQAYENLHALSADKKAWYQQLAREMAQHDEATLREEAEARGEARGKAAGQASILTTARQIGATGELGGTCAVCRNIGTGVQRALISVPACFYLSMP